jgi:transketolase
MKLKNLNKQCFCIIGDGEIQEGQIWEALMLAPKFNLDNLICLIDCNKSQNDGLVKDILPIGPLREKIKSFNWDVIEIDGNDEGAVAAAVSEACNNHNGKPKCIILNTLKGSGVSFMNDPVWHAKAPNKEEYERAIKELRC